ncbi:MAG: ion transporter [Segetibacter sp.]|nr:ion transporter [Segetibacter sp.]
MADFKTTYKFAVLILAGLAIFLSDFFELVNPVVNEIILFALCIFKASYFTRFVFGQIKETAHKDFYFHEFISFVVVSILLVIVSYSFDYYCLFRINPNAFSGLISRSNIGTELITFFYYSISVFTTAGFGDVRPTSTIAQIFVSTELMIGYFFTILVFANILLIRESFNRKNIK